MPQPSFPSLPDSVEEVAFVFLVIILAALVFGIQYWQQRRLR